MAWLYVLVDPRDSTARYVGQTSNPPVFRLAQHIERSFKGKAKERNPGLSTWVCDLVSLGLVPTLAVLKEFESVEDAQVAERRLIKSLALGGTPLFNSASNPTRPKPNQSSEEREACLVRAQALGMCKPVRASNGQTYRSMAEAARSLGIPQETVRKVLKGLQKSTRGITFEYTESISLQCA